MSVGGDGDVGRGAVEGGHGGEAGVEGELRVGGGRPVLAEEEGGQAGGGDCGDPEEERFELPELADSLHTSI